MFENRRHFRLKEFIDINWKVEGIQDAAGEGTILNISSSGLQMQTDRYFRPTDNCVLTIEQGAENLPFGSKKGRIVWFRRVHTPQDRIQCGIQFLNDKADLRFAQWFDEKVKQLGEAGDANILGNRIV